MSMAYTVKLPVFEGPFDLLLHLIAKRELDIYEVSLAQITEDYLDMIKAMQELVLELATEFLVVAATLIEIKAHRLLPGAPVDDEDALLISERDMLIARLLQYKAFKDAAGVFAETFDANAGFVPRNAGPGPEFAYLAPDLLAKISPQRFAEVAAAALAPRPERRLDLSHITPIRVTVAEAIQRVLRALADRPAITFADLKRTAVDRIDVVVRFLAVLELMKRGQADVEQTGSFGPISIRRSDTTPDASTVTEVDEYEGDPVIDVTEVDAQAGEGS
jgi:segregation and condensation protein A